MKTMISLRIMSWTLARTAASGCALAFLLLGQGLFTDEIKAETIVIDGFFNDWSDSTVSVLDVRGDQIGPFDLTKVQVKADGSTVFIRFALASFCGLQNGPEGEIGLRLVVDSKHTGDRLAVDFRSRKVKFQGKSLAWSDFAYCCLPTFASNQYELRFNATEAGFQKNDTLRVTFEGSDRLTNRLQVQLKDASDTAYETTDFGERRNGAVRVSCFNTSVNGLSDPNRVAAFGRILSAVGSDIYCFVEEQDEVAMKHAVNKALPSVGNYHVHWNAGKAIVSKFPITPIDDGLQECCIGHVRLPSKHSMVVIAAHLECCGYPGSAQDTVRFQQAQRIAKCIEKIRSGKFGESIRNSPVVVAGDFNLVGSRKPLGILERRSGLTEARLLSLQGKNAATWRSLEESSFAPGRLDFITYDAKRLQRMDGAIVDTEIMDSRLVERHGMQPQDSRVSDHLLIYADFHLKESLSTRAQFGNHQGIGKSSRSNF